MTIEAPYVQPDLAPWRDIGSGKVIEGRRQWREHVKANNLVEYGRDDMLRLTSAHEQRKKAAAARTERIAREVVGEWQEHEPLPEQGVEHTRLWARVAERLEHRPVPPRKTLIRIILEEARRTRRG